MNKKKEEGVRIKPKKTLKKKLVKIALRNILEDISFENNNDIVIKTIIDKLKELFSFEIIVKTNIDKDAIIGTLHIYDEREVYTLSFEVLPGIIF